MRILIAPNAFKGTLTARQAAAAIARGLRRALPEAKLVQCPVADGGDGFSAVLAGYFGARWIRRRVHDPIGNLVTAAFALSADGATAVIELARASGLALLKRRSPMRAGTRGTGELIAAALALGATRILIGIGGSASTDGGTGLARALGARFLDSQGRELPEGGAALIRLAHIDVSGIHPQLKQAMLQVACDVTNPLYGPRGAAFIFGPQKGASPAQVRALDEGLKHLARIMHRDLGARVQSIPGAGAAGGTGAGLAAFCGAELVGGFDLVSQTLGIARLIQSSDLVITGEGRLDRTTAHNKAPAGILRLARKARVPAVAICGQRGPGAESLGFDAIFDATRKGDPRSAGAAGHLAHAAAEMGAWIRSKGRRRTRDQAASPAATFS